jgi:hypothetical protein
MFKKPQNVLINKKNFAASPELRENTPSVKSVLLAGEAKLNKHHKV